MKTTATIKSRTNQKCYIPSQEDDGTWTFYTPHGIVVGMRTKVEVNKFAALTEKQDRETARIGTSVFAPMLNDYFAGRASA